MVTRGRVENGVVVPADGISLPEGLEVSIIVPPLATQSGHSVLDIPPFRVGASLRPLTDDDDLLDEMLENHE